MQTDKIGIAFLQDQSSFISSECTVISVEPVFSFFANLFGGNSSDGVQTAVDNGYVEKVKGKVTCRLLLGEPILHDRLIIADDQVWMLGSSLNHFGAKATTLIRVPKAYRGRLIEKVEYWWNNDSESNELAK